MNQSPNGNSTNLSANTQPLIAALYARVSTGRQESEETIDSQRDEIKKRIANDGNILPPENVFEDDGWTGEMLQRPGLDAMRDAAIAGSFQVLYVYDRGRLSRVFAYQEIVIEEIVDKGLQFVTLHDVKAETPEERVLQAMQGVFHEYERVKIAERMRRGKLFKAKNGIIINGQSLYGYSYTRKSDKDPVEYLINEDEARVVRMVFKWVGDEGVSLREVIRRFYDQRIPPRKRKSDFWTKGPIVRMLRCTTYIDGIAYYNKSEAVVAKNPINKTKYRKIKRNSRKVRPTEDWIPFKVPVILEDRVLFDKVQKILNLNQKYACKKRKYDYLLSGLVYCECGNRRTGDGCDKDNFYYRCAERIYNFPAEQKCKSPGINAVVLDQVFWKELVKTLTSPSLIKRKAEEWLKAQVTNDIDLQEKRRLEETIQKVIDEETRYSKAYGAGSLGFEQFKDLMRDAKNRKEAFKKQLDTLIDRMEKGNIQGITLNEICEEAIKVIKSLDFDNKFQVIRDIIDKVIIKGRREVEVWCHIPITQAALNMGYGPERRDCGIT
jgi:site-specific DNA recombinase